MADSPGSLSRISHNPPALQYPKLPLNESVSSWLSQSRPETMTSASQMERPSSALSEGWATLSASDIHSEDDIQSEQTDVASLIGQSGPDDVASLEGRDNDSELDSTDL